MSFFTGSPASTEQRSTFTPQQSSIFQKLFNMASGPGLEATTQYQQANQYLSDIFSPQSQGLDRLTAPYLQQFNQQVIPELSQRFANMGGLSSSGFQQQASQAASNLLGNIYSQREGARQSLLPQLLGLAERPRQERASLYGDYLSQRPFETVDHARDPGFLENLLVSGVGGLSSGAGMGLGSMFAKKLLGGAANKAAGES